MKRAILVVSSLLVLGAIPLFLAYAPFRHLFVGDPQATGAADKDIQKIDRNNLPPENTTVNFEDLCRTKPLAAVQESLAGYERTVQTFRCNFVKQEFLNNTLRPTEKIRCEFREEPFSVTMTWLENPGRAAHMIFVHGENEDQLLAVPASKTQRFLTGGFVKRSPYDKEVMQAARNPVTKFGIRGMTRGLLEQWDATNGNYELNYMGLTEIPELPGRKVHTFHYRPGVPEGEEQITEKKIYFDSEWKILVGLVLHSNEQLIARYFYQELEINPMLPEDTFQIKRFK